MNQKVLSSKLLQHPIAHRFYGLAVVVGLWSLMAFSPSVEQELPVADCGSNAVPTTLINTGFSSGASGLSYLDDAFFGTNQPNYADGGWANTYGRSGGGLRVILGGLDEATITNMSGGWEYTFSLAEDAEVNLNFWYNLILAANYESDEYADAYVSIDGSVLFLSRLVGDGNGGSAQSTGWQEFNQSLGNLNAGSHTIRLGIFNNKKTWNDETSEIYLDDFSATSTPTGPVINTEDFEAGWGSWIDGGGDATRVNNSAYANSGNYSIRLRDNSGSASSTWINLNLSTYSEITVDFSFYAVGMESGEDFFLEYSSNNGGSYTTIGEWDSGDEFENEVRYNESITIQGPFTSSSRIRFRCDASGNADEVFLDDIVIRGCEIPVNQAPVASFTATPTSGDAPLIVNFDASASSDPDGDPLTYAWNFGDGNTGSGVSPSHTYQNSGSYTATLTVSDASENSSSTEIITVSEAPDTEAPTIPQNIAASNVTQTSVDLGWDPATDNEGVVGYYIFQDGGSTPIDTVIGTSTSIAGLSESTTYQFAVAAFDAAGNVSAQSAAVQVTTGAFNQGPVANFIATPTSGEAPLSVSFDASTSTDSDGTLVSYLWDFGDGNTDSGVNTTNTYTLEGTYIAQLIVIDDSAAQDTFSVQINATSLNVGPTASFTAVPTSGEAPLEVSFDGTGSSDPDGTIISYSWNFGDGNSASGVNATNIYTIVGTYTAYLAVTDDSLATDTTFITITVNEAADTEAPTVPQNLAASNPTSTTIDLDWDAATDNVGVVGYLVYQDGSATPIDTVLGTSYTVVGLTEGTSYQFAVAAIDAAGNISGQSQAVQASTSSPATCETPSNIALGRTARQSSTYGNGEADLAIDGNTTGTSPWSADLQHTTNELQPWWEVDLGAKSKIDSIILYNRTDGFQFRLSDFYILISDSPMEGTAEELLADPAISQTFFLGGAGLSASIPMNDEGRYVRIQLMTTSLLHMAEVEVIGCNLEQVCELPTVAISPVAPVAEDGGILQLQASPQGGIWGGSAVADGTFDPSVGAGIYPVYYTYTVFSGCEATDTLLIEVLPAGTTCESTSNLALNKSASQSSTYGNGGAALAVDGNTTGTSPWSADLQHTLNESQPWWEVDLEQISDIEAINIFNRTDKNQDRLNDFYVLVSNDPFSPGTSLAELLLDNSVVNTFFAGEAGLTEVINFFATGRYVRIQLSEPGLIHVAEIEVIGCISENDPCSGVDPIVITPLPSIPEDAGIQQLIATPAGGVWGGAATADGTFDPAVGAGFYSATYTYTSGTGCTRIDSISIEVTPVSACQSVVNLALNQTATQSSTYGNGIADLAIDGVTTGNSPWVPDLQHTNNESQPWWEVDLGQMREIESIRIYNREENPERLLDFYVLVSETPFDTESSLTDILTTPVTQVFFSGAAGAVTDVNIFGQGQYVRIQLSGAGILHMAEVEVYGCGGNTDPCVGADTVRITPAGPFIVDAGIQQLLASPTGGVWGGAAALDGSFDPSVGAGLYSVNYTYTDSLGCGGSDTIQIEVLPVVEDTCDTPTNLALNQSATQSSTYFGGVAALAVDGNRVGNSATENPPNLQHTLNESQPWWQVDLGQVSHLDTLTIVNRTDVLPERLNNFYILTSIDPIDSTASLASLLQDNAITQQFFSGAADSIETFLLNGALGQYVRIQLNGSGFLHVAEIEVIGCPFTGCIDPVVTIDPAGPFAEDAGVQQLVGTPSGGLWSGSVSAEGIFDPSIGVGTYRVSYTYTDSLGCSAVATDSVEVVPGGGACTVLSNLALNKGASQSSTYFGGVASLAVDGNQTGSSATSNPPDLQHTLNEAQPWWQVDLGQKSNLSRIDIYNRSDVLPERLNNFYVFVSTLPISNSTTLNDLLQDTSITPFFFSGPAGSFESIELNDTEGRYVRVQLSGSGFLHVAEIEVWGCDLGDECVPPIVSIDPAGPFLEDAGVQQLVGNPVGGTWTGSVSATGIFDPTLGEGTYEVIYTYVDSLGCSASAIASIEVLRAGSSCTGLNNLALNRSTSQSSTYFGGTASLAVDGNQTGTSATSNPPDLQHTLNETQPWWQVDLGQLSILDQVKIYNRTDVLPERLNNFYLLISSTPFSDSASLATLLLDNAVTSIFFSGPAGFEETFVLNDLEGRYIRIQLSGSGFLHMAEVEVMGCQSPNDPCFNAQLAAIDPVPSLSLGGGAYQLTASPVGGIWSGDAAPDGTFDPGNCPGVYQVIYSYLNGGSCESADTVSIVVQPDTMEVFIYAGQSNATGAQGASQTLAIGSSPYDRAIAYAWNIPTLQNSNGWDTLQAIQVDPIRKGHGAEISFGRTLYANGYTNLGIIKVAEGGTSLDGSWDPTSSLTSYDEVSNRGMYPEMISYVNAQLADLTVQGIPYKLAGFLWHQGEGDMNPTMATRYEANLREFIDSLRSDFGPDLQVFAASVYNPNATVEQGETVRAAQVAVASSTEGVYVVDLNEIYYDNSQQPNSENLVSDNLHYNSLGQVRVGGEFASTYQSFNAIEGCDAGGLCAVSENIALNKEATQSSTYFQGTASLAVDGNRTGNSATSNPPDLQHTLSEFQPWWQVDLGAISVIEQVKVYNRTNCCQGRLNNFYVLWSDQPFDETKSLDSLLTDPLVSFIRFNGTAGLVETIQIDSTGRYVRIHHTREVILHLAEVEVIGCSSIGQAARFDQAQQELIVESSSPMVNLFPNPADQFTTMSVENVSPNELIDYSLYNLAGQRVWHLTGSISERVDLQNLSEGMYMLRVQGEGWSRSKQLLVK
ncbi:MAG: discoidin domain-containing protein [Bacteroidota bacterium]